MQALGGLRRLVCGLVKHPTGCEVLRTREIGFHVIMMGWWSYSMKLVGECDLRSLDAQVLALTLPLECFFLCITWGILAATGGRHDSEDVASAPSVRAGRKHPRGCLILSSLLPAASLDSI